MGKCREALGAEEGDVDKAVEWLRRRGVKSMEKRATEAAEALLGLSIASDSSAGAIVELKCETDYVTRSEDFQVFCLQLSDVLQQRSVDGADALLTEALGASARFPAGTEVKDALLQVGSVLGERLVMGECSRLAAPENGVVAGYVHPKFADGHASTGRMASLVSLKAGGGNVGADALKDVANQLARHIVAAQPRFLSIPSVPDSVLSKERETMKAAHLEQIGADKARKIDDKVLDKVLNGKLQKWYLENVLLCQELISAQSAEGKALPVSEWLSEQAKAVGVEQLIVEDFKLGCL